MWRRIIIAAVVGLAPVVAPVQATAAAPAPTPVTVAAPRQDCDQAMQRAQRAALAAGKSSNAVCLSRASSPTVAPQAGTMAEAGCGTNSYVFGRHSACITETGWVLNIFLVSEGGARTLVGQMFFSVTSGTVTSGHSLQWTHNFSVTMGYAWGAVAGTSLYAFPECQANCALLTAGFDYGPVSGGVQRSGRAIFRSSSYGVGSIWMAASIWGLQFANPAWLNPVGEMLYVASPAHRCDEAIGIPGSVGCVYIQKTPLHEIGSTRYPKYARHIQLAINFGLPSLLTRTQDPAVNAANRARACPQSPANGWSCDEYPYASTYEGAANPSHQYGRTFQILNWNSGYPPFFCGVSWLSPRSNGDRHGYSVCGIPLAENTGGGVDLGVFYATNRVLQHDQFSVRVV